MRIEGESHTGRLVGRVFEDPELRPAEWVPDLTALSIDIETDPRARQLYAVGLWAPGIAEVHFVQTPSHAGRSTSGISHSITTVFAIA